MDLIAPTFDLELVELICTMYVSAFLVSRHVGEHYVSRANKHTTTDAKCGATDDVSNTACRKSTDTCNQLRIRGSRKDVDLHLHW